MFCIFCLFYKMVVSPYFERYNDRKGQCDTSSQETSGNCSNARFPNIQATETDMHHLSGPAITQGRMQTNVHVATDMGIPT